MDLKAENTTINSWPVARESCFLTELVFPLEYIQPPPEHGLASLGGFIVFKHGVRAIGELDGVGRCCKETRAVEVGFGFVLERSRGRRLGARARTTTRRRSGTSGGARRASRGSFVVLSFVSPVVATVSPSLPLPVLCTVPFTVALPPLPPSLIISSRLSTPRLVPVTISSVSCLAFVPMPTPAPLIVVFASRMR